MISVAIICEGKFCRVFTNLMMVHLDQHKSSLEQVRKQQAVKNSMNSEEQDSFEDNEKEQSIIADMEKAKSRYCMRL